MVKCLKILDIFWSEKCAWLKEPFCFKVECTAALWAVLLNKVTLWDYPFIANIVLSPKNKAFFHGSEMNLNGPPVRTSCRALRESVDFWGSWSYKSSQKALSLSTTRELLQQSLDRIYISSECQWKSCVFLIFRTHIGLLDGLTADYTCYLLTSCTGIPG